ncbi:MAG: hypothetical protein K2X73_06645 [Sphingomonas sp.]|uniref:hypothetical protein n=1 Tax=Sphingomonas sp. TaxID=28214 RepID=UPI0025D3A885|nr:hypothetical protein [Sphingomonas sp.]MBX9881637.1 hypothetical protein [Sphingomonas sp.]
MIGTLLAASANSFMTLICTPADPGRARLPYVISFEYSRDRLRDVVVIWPNGSQSKRRWAGRFHGQKIELGSRNRSLEERITLNLDETHSDEATMVNEYWVSGGHIPMSGDDTATCSVRTGRVGE